MPKRARAGEEAKGQKCMVRGRGQTGVGHTRFCRAVRNATACLSGGQRNPLMRRLARVRARCHVWCLVVCVACRSAWNGVFCMGSSELFAPSCRLYQ